MYKYVIIDDEKLIRQGTVKKLSELKDIASCAGEAGNGKDGIELIEEIRPDIVILDMQMPVMDGTQLLAYLAERYPDTPLIVISGYKDFDYVKHAIDAQAVDYILKPFSKDSIQKALLHAISKLESKSSLENQLISSELQRETAYYEYDLQVIRNLIIGYQKDPGNISSKKLSYINHTYNLYLITISFQKLQDSNSLSAFLEDQDLQSPILGLQHPENPQISFLLAFFPEHPSAQPLCTVLHLAETCSDWMLEQKIPGFIGISLEHQSLSELHTAYQECSTALNLQPVTCAEVSSCYQIFQKDIHPVYLSWNRQDEFLFRIETGMEEEVILLMNDLYTYYASLPALTLGDVKYHSYLLSGMCRSIMSYYFKQDISSDSTSMQNAVSSIFVLSELKKYYCNFFLNICRMLKSQNVYADNDVIEKIKIYVDRNYQKNLSMEFLSSLFYMNRSYLSHLFHHQTRTKFVDYVNSVRIQKAQNMLLHSDRKMYQISKSAGYDNVKYFFRIFKKVTGKTPAQYQSENGVSPTQTD